ncbi:MAG: hypothetical protein Ta2G_13420 [Termitinemataceae bacterium]|nr:MAG: hypothetical protein Ta2G_13420 [Termitinemataceae bacterium]
MDKKKTYLIICSFEKEHGNGHLVRSCLLAQTLRLRLHDAFIFIPSLGTTKGRSLQDAIEIFSKCCNVPNNKSNKLEDILILDKEKTKSLNPSLIIFDNFQTDSTLFYFYKSLGITILGIDEGGAHRNDFDFLLDLLPVYSQVLPNSTHPEFLTMPKNRLANRFPFAEQDIKRKLKILICFGGEDSQGLGEACSTALSNEGLADITCPENIIENLREHLCEWDLLITHFGITAFEALYAGLSVVLVSPTLLHEKTALNAGFISAGLAEKGIAALPSLLFNKNKTHLDNNFIKKVSLQCRKISKKYNLDADVKTTLSEYIEEASAVVTEHCPVCGTSCTEGNTTPKVIERFEGRSYLLCPVCGMYFLNTTIAASIQYDSEEYFFSEYKKQYGKTYLEDFENLLRMAKRRFVYIKQLTDTTYNTKQKLLDIGCAYGAFLYASEAESFVPKGIDLSGSAVNYVCNKLNLKAEKYDFEKDNILLTDTYKVVTMWYVIEHFENLKFVLRKIWSVLQEGGVLAFSTPNAAGITARKGRKKFLENSPIDHKTILDPSKIKKLLQCFGFDVRKIVITGHHPERFPVIGKYLKNSNSQAYKIILRLSKILRLGDTFEVYALKV